jgi:shikimate dehydrogenase
MDVTGKTEVVGLFGFPVRHTASPAFQNAGFRAAGLDWIYLPFEVQPADLGGAIEGIRSLGFRGINLTIPHKQAVVEYVDELSPEAEITGAVNTIDIREGRLKGYNTDGGGFRRSIKEESGIDLSRKSIFVMGAGGAGRGVAIQAGLAGAREISVCDQDEERSRSVAEVIEDKVRAGVGRFVPFQDAAIREVLERCEVFIDATPLGMKPDDLTCIDPDWLAPSTFVYDLVYNPPETPLIRAAKERGCRTQNGLGMLLYQGCIAFEIWTGVAAPVAAMRSALEDAVFGKG